MCVARRWRALRLAAVMLAALAQASAASEPRCSPVAPPDTLRCHNISKGVSEYSFDVNGTKVLYRMVDGDFFRLKCPAGVTLEESALPRFVPRLRVRTVEFACPPPHRSYALVLRALNVDDGAINKLILTGGSLRADHLEELRVPKLELDHVSFELGAFGAVPNLTTLQISNANLTGDRVELLPPRLEKLALVNTGVGVVPRAAFAALPALTWLVVRDASDRPPVRVQAAGALRQLALSSPATVDVELDLPDELRILTLTWWAARRPVAWRACRGLEELKVMWGAAEALPADWLARCYNVRKLHLNVPSLSELHERALYNASALEVLSLANCSLKSLSSGLLDHAKRLRVLDLSDNRLLELPSGLFTVSRSVEVLRVANNRLRGEALRALAAVHSLRVLDLSRNRALDACPPRALHSDTEDTQARSELRELQNLSELRMSGTNTSQLCEDWHELRSLTELDLSGTRITTISYSHILFNTASAEVTVDLRDCNVTGLKFGKSEYESLRSASSGPVVTVRLDRPLNCDCELYWAAAALAVSARLRVLGAKCGDGRALRDVRLDELECELPAGDERCLANCSCAVRYDLAPPGTRVLRVGCERIGLGGVPDLAPLRGWSPDYAFDLRLAGNDISRLRPDDLPPDRLETLDLRNNSLSTIDEGTAAALRSRPGALLLLAGNPLDCGCGDVAALGAVRNSTRQFPDAAVAACVGGGTLLDAALRPAPECGGRAAGAPTAAVVGAAAAALLVAVAAAAALFLAQPELRLRAKAALRARGLLPRAAEDDDGRRYDAFLSFSHADLAVAREVAARLEGGAAPLRLCVHYRDWAPGGWIPDQIAASVRASRRTVVLVSESFLRSEWARAELRQAHAAALGEAVPRLVVVLLAEPAALPLDPALRGYLATNTYVRWGDPWFWEKLRRALPAPRPVLAARSGGGEAPSASSPPDSAAAPPDSVRLELAKLPGSPERHPAAPDAIPSPDVTPAGA